MDKPWSHREGDRSERVSCKAAWASDRESQRGGDVRSISAAEKGNFVISTQGLREDYRRGGI